MPAAQRPMTVAEKYYAFLDEAWPMNIMLVAELDRCLDLEHVADSWHDFCRLRVFPRIVATGELTLVDSGTSRVEVEARELPADAWDAELARESLVRYGVDTPLRLRYLSDPGAGRSRLYVIGHHAIVDGRVGMAELQLFLRLLDGQPVAPQQGLSVPAPPPTPRAWQQDRRVLIELLRTLGEANRALGEPAPSTWPAVGADRQPRFGALDFDTADTARLLAAARHHGAGALPTLAAAWLVTVTRELCRTDSAVLQLAVPVDLATPSTDPDRPTAPAVGVVARRHHVDTGAPWELAREIRAGMRESVERGDGELFLHLTRAERIDDLAAGRELVTQSLAGAPPAVSVTNLGVLDPGSDPAWVRSLCGHQAPTPNQVVFVSGVGYRGQLVNSVTTDDLRVTPDQRADLVAGYRDTVAAMLAGSPVPDTTATTTSRR